MEIGRWLKIFSAVSRLLTTPGTFWTTDPAHRDGLLSPQFRDVGISVVKGKAGTFYYTMVFGARPPQAVDPTAAPAPTLVAVVPVPPTATPNPALDAVVDLFNRTNALRAQNGLPPYRLSDKLNASAERHSQDMANTSNIDHTGSDGSTAKQRIRDTGYEAQFTGEDIYGGVATVDDAWDFWSTDPPHRATLLNQLYTDIGISVVKGQRGTYYYTMDLAKAHLAVGLATKRPDRSCQPSVGLRPVRSNLVIARPRPRVAESLPGAGRRARPRLPARRSCPPPCPRRLR